MLKGISPILTPELLKILAEMGHGDELVMAPAPGAMDGNPPIWAEFAEIVEKHQPGTKSAAIDRFAFYDRAKNAYATVATGENALYACIIIKKGCII